MKITVTNKSKVYKAKFDTYLDVNKDLNFIAAHRIVSWSRRPLRFRKINTVFDRQKWQAEHGEDFNYFYE